jgi:hypothetical protein
MLSQKQCFLRVFLIAFLLAHVAVAMNTQGGLGQENDTPSARITRIDASQFPNSRVYLHRENLNGALTTENVTLRENGATQQIVDIQTEEVGIQMALLLDAGGNIDQPGLTGQPRYIEAGEAARNLIRLGLLSSERDWLTAISFDADKKPAVLRAWDGDHQAVADSIYIYQPVADIGFTPLYDLIGFALKQFDDVNLPPHQEKSIVVFSDGVDVISSRELNDAIDEAMRRNIRIHTVMIGAETPENRRKLERLSLLTNGRYFTLSSIEALDPLWQLIADGRTQDVITYRSKSAQPEQIGVDVQGDSGQRVVDTAAFPAITVQPVTVEIAEVAPGLDIERTATAYDTPVDQLEPKEIVVRTQFSWADGLPRTIQRVEYDVGGTTEVRNEAPFDQPVAVSIASLGAGEHRLRVRAVDELGLIGDSAPLNLVIREARPPAPTATPNATLVAQAQQAQTQAQKAEEQAAIAQQDVISASQQAAAAQKQAEEAQEATKQAWEFTRRLSWLTIASIVLAVIALAFAIYVLSSKDRRKRATEVITGTFRAVTEPFIRAGRPGAGGAAPTAQLSLVDGAGTPGLPAVIPLHRGSVRIGRDPAVVNIVLDDRRVSRLHCRISEDPNGGYRVWDEGSTSGTFVNDKEVGHDGQALKSGDVIGLGPLQYRYDADASAKKPSTGTTTIPGAFDNTEPYIKRPDPPARS